MPEPSSHTKTPQCRAVREVVAQLRSLIKPVPGSDSHRDTLVEYLAAALLKLWSSPFTSFACRGRNARWFTATEFELELHLLAWQAATIWSADQTLQAKLSQFAELLVCHCCSASLNLFRLRSTDLIRVCSQGKRTFSDIIDRLACPNLLVPHIIAPLICCLHRAGKSMSMSLKPKLLKSAVDLRKS